MRTLALALLLVAPTSFAFSNYDPYFDIQEMSVEEITEDGSLKNISSNKKTYVQSIDPKQVREVIGTAREIIAFGKEIYEIVKKGKPVITTSHEPISVLPYDTDLGESIKAINLSEWKRPTSKKFKVTYKNAYGSEVVNFIYNVNMSYGGKYEGRGSYITNAQIVPQTIGVSWGYNFNASMKLVGLTNMGSDVDPIAAATIQLSYSITTIVKEEKNNMTVFVGGDGSIEQL